MWTVSEREVRPREPIFEHESKIIRSLNALCLVCCTYNQRTVLIVSQDDWQVSSDSRHCIFTEVNLFISVFYINTSSLYLFQLICLFALVLVC